ncbi:MAG: 3-isopropylmalate dehydratase small subunit [Candidatus Aminicenantales bacterium]
MKLTGTVHKYGDNVDTDVIIPARYLNTFDAAELARHCLEDLDPSFAGKVKPGDIILAGKNFGCGSSREHAPLALKSSGVCCVVAQSFARIFFRNAINIGLPILECPTAPALAESGGRLEIELEAGTVVNPATGVSGQAAPYTGFILELIRAGGLIARLRRDAAPAK